jgi:PncC family amidohydrolase
MVDTIEKISLHMRQRGLTLGLAESCTGGMISSLITDLPGASQYFQGSVVCYANEIKIQRLGVQRETLAQFGAVSDEVVREMARGACESLGAKIGLAVTGIAGPDGGTEEKPVGTIWLSVDAAGNIKSKRLQLNGSRADIRRQAAEHALYYLLECISESNFSYL